MSLSQFCARCGNLGDVVIHKNDSPKPGPGDVAIYCEHCARNVIQELPVCPHLTISVFYRNVSTQPRSVPMKYQVLGIDQNSNTAAITAIEVDGQPVKRPSIMVRADCIPPFYRVAGSSVHIAGNPLELDLFEQSGPKQ